MSSTAMRGLVLALGVLLTAPGAFALDDRAHYLCSGDIIIIESETVAFQWYPETKKMVPRVDGYYTFTCPTEKKNCGAWCKILIQHGKARQIWENK